MIPCSTSNVMYLQFVSDLQPAWVHSFLSGGTKGKEICITKCRDYDTSAFRWSKGQATEIQIAAENILKTKKRLNEILAANTGKPYDVIAADTERDYYMSAEEAKGVWPD